MSFCTARTTDSKALRSPAFARATSSSRLWPHCVCTLSSMMLKDFLQLSELLRQCPRLNFQRPLELLQRYRRRCKNKAKDTTTLVYLHDPREGGCHGAVWKRHLPVDGPMLGRSLHPKIDHDLS